MRTRSRARWARTCARTSTTPCSRARSRPSKRTRRWRSTLTRRRFPPTPQDDVTASLGALGIMAMQNRFLALLGGEGAAAAGPSELALPEVLRADIADKAAFERALAEARPGDRRGRVGWRGARRRPRGGSALRSHPHALGGDRNALVAVDEPADGPTAIVATGPVAGFAFEGGLVASVLTRLLREGHVASPDVKALLHELSPVDSAEAELLDPLTLDAGAPLRHRGGGVSPRFGALEL